MRRPASTRLCRSCRQPIATGAGKCHHCSSYQGLRRWGTQIATLGSVAIALVTVVGLVGPQVQFFFSPRTAVNVSTVAATGDHFVVLVENRGRRAVVLNRAIAFWPDVDDLAGIGRAWLDVSEVGGGDITLINGRSSAIVALYYPGYDERYDRPLNDSGIFTYADYPPLDGIDCKIEFDFVNADGSFYKYVSQVDEREDGTPYQCAPEYWNFLHGSKPVG